MIKYREYFDKIERREVVRETAKRVAFTDSFCGVVRECRENKRSSWSNWFDTWEEAHAFIMDRQKSKVESLRLNLERANGDFGRIKGMRKPEGWQ